MKRFALIILTDVIKIREFEHKDDWITARQALATAGKSFIPLKWHEGAGRWVQQEVVEM